MRISESRLRKLIREEMEALTVSDEVETPILDMIQKLIVEPEPPEEKHHQGQGESRMTKGQLWHVARDAKMMHDVIEDDADLPEWLQAKVSTMHSMMQDLLDYLQYRKVRMGNED